MRIKAESTDDHCFCQSRSIDTIQSVVGFQLHIQNVFGLIFSAICTRELLPLKSVLK